jgi:hypothetical protein
VVTPQIRSGAKRKNPTPLRISNPGRLSRNESSDWLSHWHVYTN